MNYYSPYYYGYQQPNQMNINQNMQSNYQQPQQNSNYITFIVVSSKEEVDKYIVNPNQTVNLYDNVNGIIYTKSADNLGKYSTRIFQLNELNKNNTNENKDFASKNDLISLEKTFDEKLNNLSAKFENLLKGEKESGLNE